MPTNPPIRRAVVIGASLAGLLAARVLADRFDDVVLLERDRLRDAAAPRRGTPHAVHPHGLLARGREALEALFPGFTDALQAQGALLGDIGDGVAFEADRQRFRAAPAGHVGLMASRLAIEAELRRRVRAMPGVRLVCGVDVREPVHDPAADRVTGVRYAPRDPTTQTQTLDASLVVDCSGRASRSPQWLRAWGHAAPTEDRVKIDIAYTSAYFERDATAAAGLRGVIATATAALPRPAVLLAQEPDADGRARWVLGLGGYGADQPPATFAGLRARARDLASPEMLALAERGRPIGEPLHYRFPYSLRRRYERLRRFPAGYLVLGDAIASFNPIYGQGMTVAACEALALQRALAGPDAGLHRRYFSAAARVIDIPWQLAVGGDLKIPGVPGPYPLPARLVNAYIGRLFRAAVHDAEVATAFRNVVHLLAAPPSLFAPAIVWRVLRGGGRHRVAARQEGRLADGARTERA